MDTAPEQGDNELARPNATPSVCRSYDDGTIVELIYQPSDRRTKFAIGRRGVISIKSEVEYGGERLVPFSPNNNLIKNEAVLLAAEPQPFGTVEKLTSEVQQFIHRYCDLSPTFELLAAYYVLLSWVYDAFNELPYLRLRGDYGTGKTRTLLTLGSICNRAFFASGASTVSPLFHTLDAFRGTLILDEADFRFSDEKAELVKILNNGNVKGLPVLRTMMNRQKEFNPQAFQVFGPKIVAARGSYDDRGLESRFLTEEMGGRPLRADIPINLPRRFSAEALDLRNKLLLYRFQHKETTKIDDGLLQADMEPRLNQILLPLLSIVPDASARQAFRDLAFRSHSVQTAERGNSLEGHVIEVLNDLLKEPEKVVVSIGEVSAEVLRRYGSEYHRPVTNRLVGSIIRRHLNVRAYKSHGVYVVPNLERAKIAHLARRYGIDPGPETP
jgi:hypothetical protein